MSALDTIRQERLAWLEWKDIKPMREALSFLPQFQTLHVTLEDCIRVDDASLSSEVRKSRSRVR